MIESPYKEIAEQTAKAIKQLAENPGALDNFESYLAQHYDIWVKKYANTPDGLTDELTRFSNIYD